MICFRCAGKDDVTLEQVGKRKKPRPACAACLVKIANIDLARSRMREALKDPDAAPDPSEEETAET